jgi:molybdopterin synthase catalytic subunit
MSVEQDLIQIQSVAIDLATLVRFAGDGGAGGIVTFLGTTREDKNPSGQALVALDYEAYEAMAISQMRQIAADAREHWPICKLAMVHRTGRVEVGEPSVAIVVATPHRHQAFEACRFLIDQLKFNVTIWKKEIWADGGAS